MSELLGKIANWFRRPKPKLTMAGIYGVTEDGCYIVLGEDGVMRKTPPIERSGSLREGQIRD